VTAARLFHVLAVALFAGLGLFGLFPVGSVYLAGVAVMVVLLLYEHTVVAGAGSGPIDLPRIDRAFFHANVGVSMSLFAFTLLDRVLAG
jgi:4-hydroxybenzoate polyprenyltransferase